MKYFWEAPYFLAEVMQHMIDDRLVGDVGHTLREAGRTRSRGKNLSEESFLPRTPTSKDFSITYVNFYPKFPFLSA